MAPASPSPIAPAGRQRSWRDQIADRADSRRQRHEALHGEPGADPVMEVGQQIDQGDIDGMTLGGLAYVLLTARTLAFTVLDPGLPRTSLPVLPA